jgi:hypothetical protein
VATAGDLEVSIVGRIVIAESQPDGIIMPLGLALRVGAGTEFSLDLQVDEGVTVLRVRALEGGGTHVLQSRELSTEEARADITLRLLRRGNRVIGFVNEQNIVDTPWVSTAATIELRVSNDAAIVSRVVSRVHAYARLALVLFDDEPASVKTRTEDRVLVAAPPRDVPGVVDVVVVGCSGSATLVDAFEYTFDERFDIRAGTAVLSVLNDSTLRNT